MEGMAMAVAMVARKGQIGDDSDTAMAERAVMEGTAMAVAMAARR